MTFGLVKHNNNSISAITSAGSLAQGKMTLIKEQTASSSSSISFVDGSSSVVLDSTYPIYLFKFISIHPATNNGIFSFQGSIDSGSNYNIAMTTTWFYAGQNEGGSSTYLSYGTAADQGNGTSFQRLSAGIFNDNDNTLDGELLLFNPSSTTFVKHFISNFQQSQRSNYSISSFVSGYGNTTSAVNGIQFKFESGNIDSGVIKLYGIS